jgi:hypothetical protein
VAGTVGVGAISLSNFRLFPAFAAARRARGANFLKVGGTVAGESRGLLCELKRSEELYAPRARDRDPFAVAITLQDADPRHALVAEIDDESKARLVRHTFTFRHVRISHLAELRAEPIKRMQKC